MKLKSIKEKRSTRPTDRKLNTRAFTNSGDTSQRYLTGYGALFNHPSKLLGEFVNGEFRTFIEWINPGAFEQTDMSNVIHTRDHNRDMMIGRNVSGTLQLEVDENGLKYTVAVPNTTVGNDLYTQVQRGDYFESSFVFTIDDNDVTAQSWTYDENGTLNRYINKISALYDTSNVIDGAYSDTISEARQKFNRALPTSGTTTGNTESNSVSGATTGATSGTTQSNAIRSIPVEPISNEVSTTEVYEPELLAQELESMKTEIELYSI